MRIAHSPSQLERQPRAVAIGTFDGVHRGHRQVVQAAIDSGLAPTVITFDPHPRIALGNHVELITTLERRLELLADAGAEATLVAVVHDGADGARARGVRRALPAGDRRRGGRRGGGLPLRRQAARRSRAARTARLRDPRGRGRARRLVVCDSARTARRRRRRRSGDARPAVRARRDRRRRRSARRHARVPDREPGARASPRLPALRHLRRLRRSGTALPSRSARTRTTAAPSAGSSRTCSTSTATSTASGSSSRSGRGSATRRCSRPRRSSSPRSAATSRRPVPPSGRRSPDPHAPGARATRPRSSSASGLTTPIGAPAAKASTWANACAK